MARDDEKKWVVLKSGDDAFIFFLSLSSSFHVSIT